MGAEFVWLLVVALALVFVSRSGWVRRRAPRPAAVPPPPPPDRAPPEDSIEDLLVEIGPRYREATQPADLLEFPPFKRLVDLFASPRCTHAELLAQYNGKFAEAACAALEALSRRPGDPDVRAQVLESINKYVPFTRYFALRMLHLRTPADAPLIGDVLLALDASWRQPGPLTILAAFLATRVAGGERASFGGRLAQLAPGQGTFLRDLLAQIGDPQVEPLRAELAAEGERRINTGFLASVGRVWPDSPSPDRDVLDHAALLANVAAMETALLARPPRSVLLVGHRGVGKTALVRVLATRLQRQGYCFFEAAASDLIAGAVLVGAFEERMQHLLRELGNGKRVVWFTPDLHALVFAGAHQYSPASALDLLLPAVEQGSLRLIGECGPAGYERLVQEKPRVLNALHTVRVEPLAESASSELAERWAERNALPDGSPLASADTLREAAQLAEQYLGDVARPGNLLGFLETVRSRRQRVASANAAIGPDELIATLSDRTGVPASILDDRQTLDLAALQHFFEARIKGQPEPVAALVERVALIKAGLTDPTRPQGVFLFVGPTGTGKTEIAKTLAEFLFGSAQRMIRLDMSELQTPESQGRIVGGPSGGHGRALVDLIRGQPFSVVLLDEFEKAHPRVWDLFLQVFDDGRLTDWQGNTADFRHAIIILTSNLGAAVEGGPPLGFGEAGGSFSAALVERSVARVFRPELLNRIDRVAIFRPLSRDTMREVLRRELDAVLERRGLRNRSWAVEWDETALDFLLERGFTRDLGARPLRRAVELHLLAPLARTIVDHTYPRGDQFLFVRSDGGRLLVEFVDPDAPEDVSRPQESGGGEASSLPSIALDPHGTASELDELRTVHRRLVADTTCETWQQRKTAALSAMSSPGFWDSSQRFETLGVAEYCDRIEAGVQSIGSLLERLARRGRQRLPAEHIGRAALRLHLLEVARADVREGRPGDAFVCIEGAAESGRTSSETNGFAGRLTAMYRAWAERRGMRLVALEEGCATGQPYRALLAVSGFAAHTLLAPESGLHVLEDPDGNVPGFRRWQVRVRVIAQPIDPPEPGSDGLRRQALTAFGDGAGNTLEIVRRYREEPSPLARDRVRGWRTGRLDRVLAGDFDLISG
jgi:ATP-dependent Clp protease ATP-binding subunit ClpC